MGPVTASGFYLKTETGSVFFTPVTYSRDTDLLDRVTSMMSINYKQIFTVGFYFCCDPSTTRWNK